MGKRLICVKQKSRIFSKHELMFFGGGIFCTIKGKLFEMHCFKVSKTDNSITLESWIKPDKKILGEFESPIIKNNEFNNMSFVVHGEYYEDPSVQTYSNEESENKTITKYEKTNPEIYDYIFVLINVNDKSEIYIPSQEVKERQIKRKSKNWWEEGYTEALEIDYDVESFLIEIGNYITENEIPVIAQEDEVEETEKENETVEESTEEYEIFERPKYIRLTETDEVVKVTGINNKTDNSKGVYETGAKKGQEYYSLDDKQEFTELSEEDAEYLIKND